jgi:rRNA-processing protein FCF1
MGDTEDGLRSYADLLRAEWEEIREEFLSVVGSSTIEHIDWPPGFIGFAQRRWQADDSSAVQRRHDLLVRYDRWLSRFKLLFSASIPVIDETISGVDNLVRGWIERGDGNDWSIPRSIDLAVAKAREVTAALGELIDQAAPATGSELIVVLDTNCLLRNPDLATYATLFDSRPVELVFMPVVVRELDELKDRGRSPDVRDAALKATRRIKGLRDRGSLVAGVRVEGRVSARVEPIEPEFSRVPAWLDPNTPDDRLVASTLMMQAARPTAVVVLVTGDIGLTTKAEFNGIPTIDPRYK